MKFLFTLTVLSALISIPSPNDDSPRVPFHVTSVRSADSTDMCTTGECIAKRFTVEGYTDVKGAVNSVEYVLQCDEVVATTPKLHYTLVCAHPHAHEDYLVKIWETAVSFWPDPPPKSDASLSSYNIISEKEALRRK